MLQFMLTALRNWPYVFQSMLLSFSETEQVEQWTDQLLVKFSNQVHQTSPPNKMQISKTLFEEPLHLQNWLTTIQWLPRFWYFTRPGRENYISCFNQFWNEWIITNLIQKWIDFTVIDMSTKAATNGDLLLFVAGTRFRVNPSPPSLIRITTSFVLQNEREKERLTSWQCFLNCICLHTMWSHCLDSLYTAPTLHGLYQFSLATY